MALPERHHIPALPQQHLTTHAAADQRQQQQQAPLLLHHHACRSSHRRHTPQPPASLPAGGAGVSRPGRYPDPAYVEAVLDQYLDRNGVPLGAAAKPHADAEEARVLLGAGYTWLDVRPALEVESGVGKLRSCVCVEVRQQKRTAYDSATKSWAVTTSPNPDFVKQVERRLPNKAAGLLVADTDGRSGVLEALEALDAAGYQNLVGVTGGFNAFWRVFDAKLARRPERGAFKENPWAAGDSQGLFAGES